ncbi:MAG: ComF family protein [Anaerolineae bacterium]|nr:ComF family protein [Anaerolineae bacterium]
MEGIRAAARYADSLRAAILRIKFSGWQAVAEPLSDYLWQVWQRDPLPVDILMPVPSDKARLRARGYNQSALLARGLARRIGKPVWEEALERTRPTARQVELTSVQRWQNINEAFRCRDGSVLGKAILLVDDICTTGATLEACAAALRAGGARAVWGIALARTALPPLDRGDALLPDADDAGEFPDVP